MKQPQVFELQKIAEAWVQSSGVKLNDPLLNDGHQLLHELQVHQIELEIQNEVLREANNAEIIALHRYTELFDFAPISYFSLDCTSKIMRVNLQGANLLGVERLFLTERRFLTFVTQEHRVTFSDFLANVFEMNSKQHCEISVQVGKQILWLSIDANVGVNDTDCLVAAINITERKQVEEKLKRAASVFTSAHESIIVTDITGNIVEVNEAFSRMTGYSFEEVLGKNPRMLQSGRHSPEFYTEMWEAIMTKGFWRGEIWNCSKNGDLYPEMMTISAINNISGVTQHFVSLGTDISEVKTYQGQLEHIAHYDILTNLPNRILLADRLSQAMFQCQRHNRSLAVVFMDLDGFKAINDNYGHNVGDELLIAVSQRMKEALREGDTLARIGGDEFIAVLVDLEKVKDTEPVLERLLKAAADPVIVNDVVIKVSASIGLTIYPQDGADAEQLMRHADQAMYIAKQAGKNRFHMFDTAQHSAVKLHRKSISDIRSAFDRREFVLYFQPKVNMHTGKVIGVEALIRWQHLVHGLVLPSEFLPIIEGHSVSLKLGSWVITSALSQICQWQNMGINLPISVNISVYQLQQDDFITCLQASLSDHPEVPPHFLEFEILETSALHDISKVSATMNACNKLGVRFALDDFGTGYSSLSHLRSLHAHLIKIDQTFVYDMLHDTDDLAIVEGVIGLAKAFRRDVIAEGVETVAHGNALLKLGCELVQGNGIARPMPGEDIPHWLSSWNSDDYWLA